MQNVKLLFFLAVWKRPEITEICFMGLNRLRKLPGYDINVLAVISEEEMITLCEKYDIKWVMHENLPLGRKKNFGLNESLKIEWEYLIEIGSDDLLKKEVLELYAPYFGIHDVLGMTNFCFVNSETLECRMYNSKSCFGLGRAISRKIVERMGYLWADKISHGLDNNSRFAIHRNGFIEKRINTAKPLAIDIKSEHNIWKFNYLQGVPYSFDEAMDGIGLDEINALKSLVHVEA